MTDPAAPEPMSDERLAHLRVAVDGVRSELTAVTPEALAEMSRDERKAVGVLQGMNEALCEAIVEIDRLRAALADARGECEIRTGELRQIEAIHDELNAENTDMEDELSSCRDELGNATRKIEELEAALRAAPQAPGVRVPVPADWWFENDQGTITIEYADSIKFIEACANIEKAAGPDFHTRQANHPAGGA